MVLIGIDKQTGSHHEENKLKRSRILSTPCKGQAVAEMKTFSAAILRLFT